MRFESQTANMRQPRSVQGWIKKSFLIAGLKENPMIAHNFQSLGSMDCKLSKEWNELWNDSLKTKTAPDHMRFDELWFQSSLWVLGAYELLRYINQNFDRSSKVREAHSLFKRVRIPMVKFEPPKNRKGEPVYPTDYGKVLFVVSVSEGEYGWLVGPGAMISREELAQTLYNLY